MSDKPKSKSKSDKDGKGKRSSALTVEQIQEDSITQVFLYLWRECIYAIFFWGHSRILGNVRLLFYAVSATMAI